MRILLGRGRKDRREGQTGRQDGKARVIVTVSASARSLEPVPAGSSTSSTPLAAPARTTGATTAGGRILATWPSPFTALPPNPGCDDHSAPIFHSGRQHILEPTPENWTQEQRRAHIPGLGVAHQRGGISPPRGRRLRRVHLGCSRCQPATGDRRQPGIMTDIIDGRLTAVHGRQDLAGPNRPASQHTLPLSGRRAHAPAPAGSGARSRTNARRPCRRRTPRTRYGRPADRPPSPRRPASARPAR